MFVVNQDTARRAISPLLCTEFNLLMSAYMTKKSHSLSMKPARFNFDTSNKTTVRGIPSIVEANDHPRSVASMSESEGT